MRVSLKASGVVIPGGCRMVESWGEALSSEGKILPIEKGSFIGVTCWCLSRLWQQSSFLALSDLKIDSGVESPKISS